MNRLFFLIICILLPFSVFSQEKHDSLIDTAVLNFSRQLLQFPQEKIYLQTDKPYYLSGEKVWFRAHLTDARLHFPSGASRYIYVELLNPLDSLVKRLKVRSEEGAYYGEISLSEDLPEGTYKIRAYTMYMRNLDEDYFFTKYIRIGVPQSSSIRVNTNFIFESDKKVFAEIWFSDHQQERRFFPDKITTRLNGGRSNIIKKADENGIFKVKLDLKSDESKRILYVEMEQGMRIYGKYLTVPIPDTEFDVSFYPEGGYMQEEILGKVAFKAVQANGKAINITGEIFDSSNNLIVEMATIHNGMGVFSFLPLKDSNYHVICKDEQGNSKRFELPLPRKNIYMLETNWSKENLWVKVKKDTLSDDTLYLFLHTRGHVLYVERWDHSQELLNFRKSDLPSGVLHILLLNSSLRPVSERLVFVNNNDDVLDLAFKTDRSIYDKRELIKASVNLSGDSDLQAYFSVSVTDDKEVMVDTTSSIFTNMLLTSELKGYIDSPSYYFQENNRKSALALDILMMTQGWRRYDIENMFQTGFKPSLIFPLEAGQEVSGIVKGGLLSRPSNQASVIMVAVNQSYTGITETDKDGRFSLNGFELPDTTRFFIQALSKKGSSKVELILDQETFPSLGGSWKYYPALPDNSMFREYVYKADQKYTFENGMRMIHLDQVEIKARKKTKKESKYYSSAFVSNSFSEEDIEKLGVVDIFGLLMTVPGVHITDTQEGRGISIRGQGQPLLVIDDMVMDFYWLNTINIFDIEQVDVLKDIATTAIFGPGGSNGVISIYTKKGIESTTTPRYNIAQIVPLGYHQPSEFYSPKYDTKEAIENKIPDLRTTLYWNPDIKIDGDGNADFEFYSSDASTSYSVVIEGMTKQGKFIYHKDKITVKNE